MTVYGAIGASDSTHIQVNRLTHATGFVESFKNGNPYDSFTNQTLTSAMALTLDSPTVAGVVNQLTYSYFLAIDPQPSQSGTTITSIKIEYTVTGPN